MSGKKCSPSSQKRIMQSSLFRSASGRPQTTASCSSEVCSLAQDSCWSWEVTSSLSVIPGSLRTLCFSYSLAYLGLLRGMCSINLRWRSAKHAKQPTPLFSLFLPDFEMRTILRVFRPTMRGPRYYSYSELCCHPDISFLSWRCFSAQAGSNMLLNRTRGRHRTLSEHLHPRTG